MNLAIVKSRLDRLISDGTPRVMLMTGGWGGGKTYQWKSALRRKPANANIGRYAYVSLFGINSLLDLKRRVAEESILELPIPDSENTTTLEELSSSLTWRSQPWKLVKLLPAVPYLNKLEGLASELSFMAVKHSVICFDDIERRGAALSLRDFFGLVTYLKDERGCRVLMIADDRRLDNESKNEFEMLLEKVVDEHVAFKPSPEEAVGIALAGVDPPLAEILRPHLLNLQTANIRAAKKIVELAIELNSVLFGVDTDVFNEAIRSLALFGAGHWLSSDGYPPIRYSTATSHSWSRYLRGQKGPEPTDQDRIEEAWDQIISRMGYLATSNLDKEIAKSVERGFFVKDALLPFAVQDAQSIDSDRRRRFFSQEWGRFFRSVQGESGPMLENLYAITIDNLHVISQGDAELAWQTFKDAKMDAQANDVLERFISVNKEIRPGVFQPTHIAPGRGADPEFRRRMQHEASLRTTTETLTEVLDRIQINSGYASHDVDRIASSDFAELEKILRESDPNRFRSRILALIRLRELNSTDNPEGAEVISTKAIQFLRGLVAADPLMQIRIGDLLPTDPPSPGEDGS